MNEDQALGFEPEVEQEYSEDWLRRVREAGASEQVFSAARARQRVDRNATLEYQMSWLEDAGFDEVAGVYQDRRFVVYGGRKAEKKEVEHG